MARYPAAIWSQLSGIGAYASAPFKIIHHTTEGGSAAGAIATYRKTKNYPHFTVEEDVVYQHVDTNSAVTALEHPPGTIETNRSCAIQIEIVGYAGRQKSRTTLRTVGALCRWLESQHGIAATWPSGHPYPPVNGKEPTNTFNRSEANWTSKSGHYGHCHVPNNHHWDPGYTADEVAVVMLGAIVAEAEAEGQDGGDEVVAAFATSDYVTRLVGVAEGEYRAYHTILENQEPLRSRIDAYCLDIGIPAPHDISAFPWSATFVSWCIKKAGATRLDFTFSAAHAVFVRAAIANADAQIGVFRARPIGGYGPRVGDLIHKNRSGGIVTYAEARVRSDYPSHSAIVFEVGEDQSGRYAITIGGNEHDSVRKTRVALDGAGLLVQSMSNPYICVVQDLKIDPSDAEAPAQALSASGGQRLAMAKIIVGFEARRDKHGRLEVYKLPADDGGGRYEVAGINERFDKAVCDELVALIENGQQAQAETRAAEYIAGNTDVAATWTRNPGVEFYLRDCVFNRGRRGAAWILQTAVGVEADENVGSHTLAAVAGEEQRPILLLDKLREAREGYERLRRDESSRFWKGLVNRWNNALTAAKTFLPNGSNVAPGTSSTVPTEAAGDAEFDLPPATATMGPASEDLPFREDSQGDAAGAATSGGDATADRALAVDQDGQEFATPLVVPRSIEAIWYRPAAASAFAVTGRASVISASLDGLHREVEGKLFGRAASALAVDSHAPPGPATMIAGVGIGAAHKDFESVGSGGPGAPVLNIYVTEAMTMETVRRILFDSYGVKSLAPDTQPVNVHYTGPITRLTHTHRERPSPCGISVGHFKVTAGTQGVLARGRSDDRRRRLLVISNNHVLANENDCQAGDSIHQPGPHDMPPSPNTQIGILEKWVNLDFKSGDNYVDCAAAWCWPDRVTKTFIRQNAGAWSYFNVDSAVVEPAENMLVGKSGRTTQLTSGRIIDVRASLSVNYGQGRVANFRDQMTITGTPERPFSDGGDSGSLVWTWDAKRNPVGLLFAGGREYTFVNKLSHVIEALDIELVT